MFQRCSMSQECLGRARSVMEEPEVSFRGVELSFRGVELSLRGVELSEGGVGLSWSDQKCLGRARCVFVCRKVQRPDVLVSLRN